MKQKEHHGEQEEYRQIHDIDYKVLKEYFGLSEDFPQDQLLCATVGNDPILNPSKKFRFITREVKNLLEHDPQKHLKILNIGCKIIERGKESFGGSVAPFRIAQEGLSYIMPYMTKRILDSNLDSFLFLIEKKNIKEEQLLDVQLLEKIREIGHGCFVLRSGNDSVVCQYFRNSISLMCSGEQSENFLIRHGKM